MGDPKNKLGTRLAQRKVQLHQKIQSLAQDALHEPAVWELYDFLCAA